jgi:hypothetical protein
LHCIERVLPHHEIIFQLVKLAILTQHEPAYPSHLLQDEGFLSLPPDKWSFKYFRVLKDLTLCMASFLQHLCPQLLLLLPLPLLLQFSSPEKKMLLRYHHAKSPLHDQTHFSQFLTTAVDLQSVQQENNWGRTHSWKSEKCPALVADGVQLQNQRNNCYPILTNSYETNQTH